MLQLVLTDEQAEFVATAFQPIQICDKEGNVFGYIKPVWTEEELAAAKKVFETNKVWHTTEQILAHLRSLETQ